MANGKKNGKALEGISDRLYKETTEAYEKRAEAGGKSLLPDMNKKGYLPVQYSVRAGMKDPSVMRTAQEMAIKASHDDAAKRERILGRGQNLSGRQPKPRGGF